MFVKLIPLLAINIIIFIHEFGHYFFARLNNIGIEVFSIGMGPVIFSFEDKNGTKWQLCCLPIGGYVQPKELNSDKNKNVKGFDFEEVSMIRKISVILAGPLFNFLLPFFISFLLLVFSEGIFIAFIGAFCETFCRICIVSSSLFSINNSYSKGSIQGVLGILKLISEQKDFFSFLYIISSISIALGVMNLLPIPSLDGGRIFSLLFNSFVGFFGIKIPDKMQDAFYFLGVTLIIGLGIIINLEEIVALFYRKNLCLF